jgi:hypothetical protein
MTSASRQMRSEKQAIFNFSFRAKSPSLLISHSSFGAKRLSSSQPGFGIQFGRFAAELELEDVVLPYSA